MQIYSTILSIDTPSGTGDHENYFSRRERVLEFDGKKVYKECSKKAAVVRESTTHVPWFSTDFTFLFSNNTKFYSNEKVVDPNEIDRYTRALHPEYGYVKFNIKGLTLILVPML